MKCIINGLQNNLCPPPFLKDQSSDCNTPFILTAGLSDGTDNVLTIYTLCIATTGRYDGSLGNGDFRVLLLQMFATLSLKLKACEGATGVWRLWVSGPNYLTVSFVRIVPCGSY